MREQFIFDQITAVRIFFSFQISIYMTKCYNLEHKNPRKCMLLFHDKILRQQR